MRTCFAFVRLSSRYLPRSLSELSKLSWSRVSPCRLISNGHNAQPADNPAFRSVLDRDPVRVRSRRRHGPGLIVLAAIPIIAFSLGTWQIKRLDQKTTLIAQLDDRLALDPLPLPPRVDPTVLSEFDYRRVVLAGRFRHDQEMLLGPRIYEGENGFCVITPFERLNADGVVEGKILVNRGWIKKSFANIYTRDRAGIPLGSVLVQGLLRKPFKGNMFTPNNDPEKGQFQFADVKGMAELTGSQPVWVEATVEADLLEGLQKRKKGIPIGRAAKVELRNNHVQYIVTWYGLAVATSVMFYLLIRRPKGTTNARVRLESSWS